MSKKSTPIVRLPPGRAQQHGGYSYLTTGNLPEHRREVSHYLTAARESLILDLGPKEEDLSAGQLILIDRIVTKLGVIRCMEEHVRENSVMSGHNLAPCLRGSYLAYNNSVRLDLTALGIDKRAAAKVLDLGEYIQAADAAKIEKDKATASNPQAIAPLRASGAILESQGESPEPEKSGPGDEGQGKVEDEPTNAELPGAIVEPEKRPADLQAGAKVDE